MINFVRVSNFYYVYRNTNMKTQKIFNICTTFFIIVLLIWIFFLYKNLKETEEVLQQCSDRYYKEINQNN